jgi:hypothetical protein
VIGIDWGFAPRAFRVGASFSRASFENHSISLAVTRLTERPLASQLVGPVGCVFPRDRNCWGICPARVQSGSQFQSTIVRESFDFSGGNAVDRAPAGFQIGWASRLCVPARSELLGNSARARSEWESVFSPAACVGIVLPKLRSCVRFVLPKFMLWRCSVQVLGMF